MKNNLGSHNFGEIYKELDIHIDKLGCIMLNVKPLTNMYPVEVDGAGVDLYYSKNPNRPWISGWVVGGSAHITLLYGLLGNGNIWREYVQEVLEDWKLSRVNIDKIDYFESPYKDEQYYCIVAFIKVTPRLLEAEQRLSFLPHINTFPEYKPHMTICYIKKDAKLLASYLKEFNALWSGKRLETMGIDFGYRPKPKDKGELVPFKHCRCGAQKKLDFMYEFMPFPEKLAIAVCPQRHFWNWWLHDDPESDKLCSVSRYE